MPPSGWVRYPAAWLRARTGRIPERPWLVPAAIRWLRRRIRSEWSILELGAGRSTPWFARRAARLISLTRIDCLDPATHKVRAGGYLLLDDSDRPGYAAAFELLAGWRFHRFVGVKDGWPETCETGIFTRPSPPA